MAKKRTRAKYISKGQRANTDRTLVNSVRKDVLFAVKYLNKLKAWMKGKDVFFTIENPNKLETNRKFIRVSGRELYGDPKKATWSMPKRDWDTAA
jgi:hypothetical protein